jgi:hypothetical protein
MRTSHLHFEIQVLIFATDTVAFNAFGALTGPFERSAFAAYGAAGYDTKAVDKFKSKCRRERQLSSFSYSAVGRAIRGRALLEAVPVAEVNSAFTSVIGRIK